MGNETSNNQTETVIEIKKEISDAMINFSKELSKLSFKEQREKIMSIKVTKNYKFSLNKCIPYAKYALHIDKKLNKLRSKIVPQLIKEDIFWKKYFYILFKKYNVSPIKQPKETKIDDNLNDIILDQMDNETKPKNDKNNIKNDEIDKSNNIDIDNNKNKDDNIKNNGNNIENNNIENNNNKTKVINNNNNNNTIKNNINNNDDESYQVLLIKPWVFLYKIPPNLYRHRNNKCQFWGLRNPIWQGRLRIVGYNHGKEIQLQFLEKKNDIYQIYLKGMRIDLTKIDDEKNPLHLYFDLYGVIDSSRYFIFWIETPTKIKKKIPFGFGLKERQDAFDIRAAIADQRRFVFRQENANLNINNNDNSNENDNDNGKYGMLNESIKVRKGEFELKEDEMIEIGKGNKIEPEIVKKTKKNIEDASNNDNNGLYLIAGPPSPPPQDYIDQIKMNESETNMWKYIDDEVRDDDWGDFQGVNDFDNINNENIDKVNDIDNKIDDNNDKTVDDK